MATEEVALNFLYIAPAVVGLVIGIIEMFFVMQDEGGMNPISHGLHALPTCLLFTYVSMNASFFGTYLSTKFGWAFLASATVANIAIPIIIGLIATIKVKTAAAIIGGHGSIGEKMGHALMIGILIAIAPFIWPLIAGFVPVVINK